VCILREGFGWLGATQKLINLFFSWYFLASEVVHIRGSWLYSLLLLGCVGDLLAPWLALCISSEYFFPFELRWAYPTHILSSVVSYLVLCIVAVAVAVARSRSRCIPSSSIIFTWTSSKSTWPIFFSKSIGIGVVLQY